MGAVLAGLRIEGSAGWLLVAVGAHAATSLLPVRLLRDGETHALTLAEAVLVVLLATGAGDVAPLAALLGLFVGNVLLEVDRVKMGVNIGSAAIAAEAGVQVHALVAPAQPGLDGPTLVAAGLGGLVAWALTLLVVGLAIALATDRSYVGVLRRDSTHALGGLVGNLVVGVPLAGLASVDGRAVALGLPLVALAVRSQGQVARTAELRASSAGLQALSQELLDVPLDDTRGPAGAHGLVERALRSTGRAFRADAVSLAVPGGRSWRWERDVDDVVAWEPPDEPPEPGRNTLVATVRLEGVHDGVLVAEGRRGVEPWDRTDVARLAMVADDLAASLRTRWLLRDLRDERDALAVTTGALERVVAAVGDGVVTVDGEGVVRSWNAAMARLTGRPAHEAIGRALGDVLVLDDAPEDVGGEAGFAEALDGGVEPRHEVTVRWRSGERERLLTVRRREAVDDATIVFVVRDVTARRQQEALQRDFVTTVSHELRTPLTTLQGAIDLLLEEPPEDRREALHAMVGRQLVRLDRLARQFAAFADVILGGHHPAARPLDLAERLDGLGLLDRVAPGTVEIPRVVGVPDVVDQAIAALVANAEEHGGGLDRLVVEVLADRVELHVVDQGVGVPSADRDRVFRPFVRLGEPGTRGQGTGLGLAIARGGLRTAGGDVQLGPGDDGVGTIARVVLPRATGGAPQRSLPRAA